MKIKLIEIQEAAWKPSWPCTRIFMMFMLLQKALHTTACNSIIQWNSCLCLHRYLCRFVLLCIRLFYFPFSFFFLTSNILLHAIIIIISFTFLGSSSFLPIPNRPVFIRKPFTFIHLTTAVNDEINYSFMHFFFA